MAELSNAAQYQVYVGMVAGVLPLGQDIDVDAAIRIECEDILGTRQVHTLQARTEGQLHYLAVPSRLLSSASTFLTPLSAALPGNPGHVGDAAYVVQLPPYAAAVIRSRDVFKLVASYADEVKSAIAAEVQDGEPLRVVELDDEPGVPMRSEAWFYRRVSERVSRLTAMVSLGLIGLSAVVSLASSIASGALNAGRATKVQAVVNDTDAALRGLSLVQPLQTQLQRILLLNKVVVETGGWIDGYRYSATDGDQFALSLPSWVTQDTIQSLGEGVHTELQTADNRIWVTKTNRVGATVPGVGPQTLEHPGSGSGPAPHPAAPEAKH